MLISNLFRANIQSLKSAESMLSTMADEDYRAIAPPFTASVGKHLRHITDHYQMFFDGIESGYLDYDGRKRVESEENQRATMIMRLRQVCDVLERMSAELNDDQSISVKLAVDEGQESPVVPSTISRELVFLQSHTVHHYAIIAGILQLRGRSVSADFGIAPSTLKYERHQDKENQA